MHTPIQRLKWLIGIQSIVLLLNNCQKLTHLSLTGVQAFLRSDLERYCREAPPGKWSLYKPISGLT